MTQTDRRPAGINQRTADLRLYLHELFDGTTGYMHAATLDRRTAEGIGWTGWRGIREAELGIPDDRPAMLDGLAEKLVLESDLGVDVFTCPYPLMGARIRAAGRATARRHAHADIDGPVDLERARALGAWAVASGSTAADGTPHGNIYVRMTESVPEHAHTALCRALGQAIGGEHHDTGKVHDNDVLRPPGTLNHKRPGDPRPVAWLIRPDDIKVRTWEPEALARELGAHLPGPEPAEGLEPGSRGEPAEAAQATGEALEPAPVTEGLAARRVDGLVRMVAEAERGAGNDALNYAAGRCAALCTTAGEGLDPAEVRERLVQAYRDRPSDEPRRKREQTARATLRSGWSWGERNAARALEDRRGEAPMTHEEHLAMTEGDRTEEEAAADEPDATSWRPVDLREVVRGLREGRLTRPRPTVGEVALAPEDGPGALLYRGKVNGLAGESNAGKSWTALVVARQELERGEAVLYLDLEDDMVAMTDRLLQMGTDLDQVAERFAYVNPAVRFDAVARADLRRILDRLAPSLVVVDSVGEALSLEGMRPNEDDEVARWFRLLPRWLAGHECEPAVLVLDHVPKVEGGLWPIGSQRKRAAITGAQYMQERRSPFSQGRAGYSVLKVAKDRHGAYATGETAAHLVVTPGGGGVAVDLVSGTPSAQALTTADPLDQAVAALDRIGYPHHAPMRYAWEFLTKRIPVGPERPRKSDVEQAQKMRQKSAEEGSE